MRETYSRGMARSYDRFTAHFFPKFKKLAFSASSLRPGDSALVFCRGTGLDFPHILEIVGAFDPSCPRHVRGSRGDVREQVTREASDSTTDPQNQVNGSILLQVMAFMSLQDNRFNGIGLGLKG